LACDATTAAPIVGDIAASMTVIRLLKAALPPRNNSPPMTGAGRNSSVQPSHKHSGRDARAPCRKAVAFPQ
jgi:hypothetical protein